jgi:2-amino-4-hydroxy-6-hydroxymethyldihydropteridine diphosphokinase
MAHIVYISLGSNLGDRIRNLNNAITCLAPKVRTLLKSSIYETEPWGYTDQPSFLNQVIKGETEQEPMDLLVFLKDIEVRLGRKETFRFGPRLIDLDILFYDDLVLDTPQLTIPHPRITERAFVIVPLAEISPELVHPIIKKTIQGLKTSVDPSSIELFEPAKP